MYSLRSAALPAAEAIAGIVNIRRGRNRLSAEIRRQPERVVDILRCTDERAKFHRQQRRAAHLRFRRLRTPPRRHRHPEVNTMNKRNNLLPRGALIS